MIGPAARAWAFMAGMLQASAALAAALAPGVDTVRFRVLDESDGLPQASVSAVVEDARGFIWLGTQDGLARFDGHGFQVMRRDPQDAATLADSYVQALALAGETLWVASPALGLSRLDLGTLELRRYGGDRGRAHGLAEDAVTALFLDRRQQLWVALAGLGLQRYDAASDRFVDPPFELPHQRRIRVVGDSPIHGLLVAVDDALWRWRGAGAPERLLDAGAPVLATAEAGVDLLWVASQGNGVFGVDAEGRVRRHLTRAGTGLVDDDAMRLLLDSRGRLWIGQVGGLCRLEAGEERASCWQTQAGLRDGLPGNRVTALMEDGDGRIWVGTWTGGVAVHAPEDERFLRIGPAAGGLPSRAVAALAEAGPGAYWVSLIDGGGLVRLDLSAGASSHSFQSPALAELLPLSLLQTDAGLWVGSQQHGLVRIAADGSEWHLPPDPEQPLRGPPGRAIQSLHRDRDGRLWVGTLSDGLGMLCDGCAEFRHYRSQPEDPSTLSTNSINDILQTRDGQLWLAMRRGGVNRIDAQTGRVTRYTLPTPEGERVYSATHLFEDRAGRLWVGTTGYGLLLFERDERGEHTGYVSLTRRDGLPSDSVGAVLQDAAGWLWVSTTSGLARVQPEQRRAQAWRPFSLGRGEDYFVGSAVAASDGYFLFGGINGITAFRPEQAVPGGRPPEVHLSAGWIDHQPWTRMRRDGQAEIDLAQALTLHYPQQRVDLELAARPLLAAAPLRFAYRLDPIDADWSELPADQRQLGFGRLAPGSYRLQLRARLDGSDDWGPTRELALQVAPPPWRSPWAFALYLLAAGSLSLLLWLHAQRIWRERRAAAAALAQSETLLRQSLWGSRGELWDCDLVSGRIRRENPLPHLKVDADAAEQSLRGLRPYVHAEDRDAFDAGLRRCLSGDSEYLQVSYRTLDDRGQWRWMLTRGKLLERDDSGRPLRLVGTTFDISEERVQEDALRESQARLRMALWGSGDELWDLDVRANRVHRENALAAVQLPTALAFRDSLEYLDLAHPDDREAFRDAMRSHVAGRTELFEASFRLPAREGCGIEGWVWVLGRGRAVERDAAGKALRVVGTNRDITQLKAAEAALKALNGELEARVAERTAALEHSVGELQATLDQLRQTQGQLLDAERMATMGNLVAGVAHDLNTPVGIGVTAASHLHEEAERMARRLDEGQLRRSELAAFVAAALQSSALIQSNLERAGGLVGSFKQVAVDQLSGERRRIDLRRYLEEVLRSLQPSLKPRAPAIELDCPPGLMLETQPGAIYQIIANLVLNAVIHAWPGQKAGTLQISARLLDGVLELVVADDGCGMDAAVRERIFEAFYTTRRGQGGSGLGLHIVHNLCTVVLAGSIHCDSAPGQGTRFVMQLPLDAEAESATQVESP